MYARGVGVCELIFARSDLRLGGVMGFLGDGVVLASKRGFQSLTALCLEGAFASKRVVKVDRLGRCSGCGSSPCPTEECTGRFPGGS